ncbi:tetratricopeptide repeat protein [Tepidimonas taiwanensis]|uniref:Ancillary SecYEG translocon subunit n=1 Tax=Tepidimonas taiwanensis TaxID=307486 RepID=A0A554X7X7_9BURK|nr:tetratricopeptide repeat protein [Tepidimonas taiwanensis]MCX7693403.1 tetratricopeptide repeat protein [Tepidimonas taiwanensis]MDM7464377.1 tetratricopeptide repeat protein [Tepidimonas taiwanensis]TSE31939.1 Tetratricopeptide repeat-like domain protein [Tepidimonas taiwanensis]UBQ06290.1 tetratricopeptide repeat protein [Tepidimonas taiwanensis]
MASHYDLEEQEQIAQLKAFWARWGNAITWLLIAVLAAYAAYNGWQYWQNRQAVQAAALFDELEQAARADDVERVRRVWTDLQAQAARTTQAQHGALLAARVFADAEQSADARAALQFVIDRARDDALAAVARLRLAGIELDAGQPEAALKLLEAEVPAALRPWRADRRGDVLQRLGRIDEAREAYREAWRGMDSDVAYRGIVEAKLNALGVDPGAEPEAKP